MVRVGRMRVGRKKPHKDATHVNSCAHTPTESGSISCSSDSAISVDTFETVSYEVEELCIVCVVCVCVVFVCVCVCVVCALCVCVCLCRVCVCCMCLWLGIFI